MIGKRKLSCVIPGLAVLLAGCGAQQYEFDPEWHISQESVSGEEPVSPSGIPDLIGSTAALPELAYEGQADTYDVLVENVSIRTVLTSLADQAQVNLDVDPFLDGPVNLSAYDQTLTEILERLSRQLPIRYERIGETLVVLRDNYYVKQYYLHYPDLTRTFSSTLDGAVTTSGSGSLGVSSLSADKGGSGSVWQDLEEAVGNVLTSLDTTSTQQGTAPPAGDDADQQIELGNINLLAERVAFPTGTTSFVFTLPDAGLLIVYGNSKQQEIASDIIEKVSTSSRRQVLLQATVVEIALNNQYQQGIDWSIFNRTSDSPKLIQSGSRSSGTSLSGLSLDELTQYRELVSTFTTDEDEINNLVRRYADLPNFRPATSAAGGFLSGTFSVGDLSAAVSLLDKFGDTRVVSSPRISTLNGQGAILKVVTDQIYFSTEVLRERDTAGIVTETITVEEETVPVGFVVSVYPQIGEDGTIILAMRPSISRVVGTAAQPTVGTVNAVVSSGVPIVSIKEIETLMMINDGQTAVMGGLIEDQLLDANTSVPGIASIPGLGNLFKNKDERTNRVEYVIFVSAKIVTNPSLYGDYSDYRDLLPSENTFRRDQTDTFFNRSTQDVPRGE